MVVDSRRGSGRVQEALLSLRIGGPDALDHEHVEVLVLEVQVKQDVIAAVVRTLQAKAHANIGKYTGKPWGDVPPDAIMNVQRISTGRFSVTVGAGANEGTLLIEGVQTT